MDADTKLVPCVAIGSRNASDAHAFISDPASRLRYRIQMTTDGHRPYLETVEAAFGAQVDYAMLVKVCGNTDNPKSPERRYSPAECIGTSMRRYTRLSYGFNWKVENHLAAVSLNYFAYNFCKIHRTLRVTPAMAAGVVTGLMTFPIWWRRSKNPRTKRRRR